MIDAILIGGGGHAKSMADSIRAEGKYHIVGIVDPVDPKWEECPWLGNDEELSRLYKEGIHTAFIGIGFMGKDATRQRVLKSLAEIGFELPAVIDPTAVVSSSAKIGEASFIGKAAVINVDAKIGKAAIINTGAIVDHESVVGDFTHVAVGAKICGCVNVSDGVFIGAGATVINGIRINADAVVGAGSVVVDDVDTGCTVVGVPARKR